jgi:hypothetical protein
MVTRILDMLIENAVNHSKIVATEIIHWRYFERGSKDWQYFNEMETFSQTKLLSLGKKNFHGYVK